MNMYRGRGIKYNRSRWGNIGTESPVEIKNLKAGLDSLVCRRAYSIPSEANCKSEGSKQFISSERREVKGSGI